MYASLALLEQLVSIHMRFDLQARSLRLECAGMIQLLVNVA